MNKEVQHEFGEGPGELFEGEYKKPLPMRLDRWLVSQRAEQSRAHVPVSYTHLTLPTIYSV